MIMVSSLFPTIFDISLLCQTGCKYPKLFDVTFGVNRLEVGHTQVHSSKYVNLDGRKTRGVNIDGLASSYTDLYLCSNKARQKGIYRKHDIDLSKYHFLDVLSSNCLANEGYLLSEPFVIQSVIHINYIHLQNSLFIKVGIFDVLFHGQTL